MQNDLCAFEMAQSDNPERVAAFYSLRIPPSPSECEAMERGVVRAKPWRVHRRLLWRLLRRFRRRRA